MEFQRVQRANQGAVAEQTIGERPAAVWAASLRGEALAFAAAKDRNLGGANAKVSAFPLWNQSDGSQRDFHPQLLSFNDG
jgi:hypothetical protein